MFDAVVVGSGPNGLSAAILLQSAGLSVLLVEGRKTFGGGMRTEECTLPGLKHDICSAIHPLAIASPFLKTLPLHEHGLRFLFPVKAAAHPLLDGSAAWLCQSVEASAASLGQDADAYQRLMESLLPVWRKAGADILAPLHWPKHPWMLAKFGLKAMQPSDVLKRHFQGDRARGLWAGMAAHSILPLNKLSTSAIGLVLMLAAHDKGWPIPEGGSQSIADSMVNLFVHLGGQVESDFYVRKLSDLPESKVILFDTSPRQMTEIAGESFSSFYKWQLNRYKYGMGVFKIDWAIEGDVPFTAEECRDAGTVHLGNTYEEIAYSEKITWQGKHPDNPFVLLAQQAKTDGTRRVGNIQPVWGYCHVPLGSDVDMTEAIENQIERFAPGFKDRIIAKRVMNTRQFQDYNPNYIGGDINGGALNITQLFTRPAWRFSPYSTPAKGIYLCSASTPPGGGVHGMSGYYAARRAFKDVFKIKIQHPWEKKD